MKRDLVINPMFFTSSFLSCEKDYETIIRRLFIESQPYSDHLKRLLVLSTPDCLDNKTSETYNKIIRETTVDTLRRDGYLKIEPKLRLLDHEDIKAYIIVEFDNFTPNATNPEFRDHIISFDIICHFDQWHLKDFQLRPYRIAAEIDSMIDKKHLAGIGETQFLGANQIILNDEFAGISLMYSVINGEDDRKNMLNPEDNDNFIEEFNEIFNS